MAIHTMADEPSGRLAPGQNEDGTFTRDEAEGAKPQLTGAEKALADTKAELTRVQQELAALRKGAAPEPEVKDEAKGKPEEQPSDKPEDKAQQLTIEEVTPEQAEQVAAVDLSEYQTEFTQTRDVTPENRDKIAEKLKPILGEHARQLVDDYIEGAKVRTQNYENNLMETAGGKERFGQMVEWAKGSLSVDEKKAFNAAVNSGDYAAANLAISGLRMRFEQGSPKAPKLLGGTSAPSTDSGVYKSTAEMRKDMSDPRYKADPAFRRSVAEKLARSDIM